LAHSLRRSVMGDSAPVLEAVYGTMGAPRSHWSSSAEGSQPSMARLHWQA
jgi:hypothetical protein